MNILPLLLALVAASTVRPGSQNIFQNIGTGPVSKEDAARVARTLVSRESLVNVNTLRKKDGLPTSSIEYYVDCDNDGDFYWLVVDIGSPNVNIENGSPYLFSIRTGDHPPTDNVDISYPGGIESLVVGSPRLSIEGKIVPVHFDHIADRMKLNLCFVRRHPDSKFWLPDLPVSPHKTHWVKVMVENIYMIGGFGDRAYIGEIDGDLYHAAQIL